MEWHRLSSPSQKKARTVLSAAKVIFSHSFLVCERVDFGRLFESVGNHECFSLCRDAAQAASGVARLTDSRRDHPPAWQWSTAPHVGKNMEIMSREVHLHPRNIPGSATSNCYLFGLAKDEMQGQYFERIERIQTAVRHCIRKARINSYNKGIFKFPERWEKYLQRDGNYVEN